jgi:hypothetical protein
MLTVRSQEETKEPLTMEEERDLNENFEDRCDLHHTGGVDDALRGTQSGGGKGTEDFLAAIGRSQLPRPIKNEVIEQCSENNFIEELLPSLRCSGAEKELIKRLYDQHGVLNDGLVDFMGIMHETLSHGSGDNSTGFGSGGNFDVDFSGYDSDGNSTVVSPAPAQSPAPEVDLAALLESRGLGQYKQLLIDHQQWELEDLRILTMIELVSVCQMPQGHAIRLWRALHPDQTQHGAGAGGGGAGAGGGGALNQGQRNVLPAPTQDQPVVDRAALEAIKISTTEYPVALPVHKNGGTSLLKLYRPDHTDLQGKEWLQNRKSRKQLKLVLIEVRNVSAPH